MKSRGAPRWTPPNSHTPTPYSLRKVTPRVWRRVKVSAGMRLDLLQDRVLIPLMGFCRHYHAYYFTDYKDGARGAAWQLPATSRNTVTTLNVLMSPVPPTPTPISPQPLFHPHPCFTHTHLHWPHLLLIAALGG